MLQSLHAAGRCSRVACRTLGHVAFPKTAMRPKPIPCRCVPPALTLSSTRRCTVQGSVNSSTHCYWQGGAGTPPAIEWHSTNPSSESDPSASRSIISCKSTERRRRAATRCSGATSHGVRRGSRHEAALGRAGTGPAPGGRVVRESPPRSRSLASTQRPSCYRPLRPAQAQIALPKRACADHGRAPLGWPRGMA